MRNSGVNELCTACAGRAGRAGVDGLDHGRAVAAAAMPPATTPPRSISLRRASSRGCSWSIPRPAPWLAGLLSFVLFVHSYSIPPAAGHGRGRGPGTGPARKSPPRPAPRTDPRPPCPAARRCPRASYRYRPAPYFGHALHAHEHAAARHQLAPGFVARLFLGRFRRVLRHAGLPVLIVFVLLVHSYSFLNPCCRPQADTRAVAGREQVQRVSHRDQRHTDPARPPCPAARRCPRACRTGRPAPYFGTPARS